MCTKKPKIKKVRNILESPFHVQKWTEKSENELRPLKNDLKLLLPVAKLEQVALKRQYWKKQDNKETTNDVLTKGKQQNIYRQFLAPGFQSVVRGLEKRDLCCVILAGNITPLLQKVVLAYTQINCVPVTIVSDLKKITKSALGFPTMVLGFKNVLVNPENKFAPIYNLVSQNQIIFDETPPRVEEEEEEDVVMDQTACVSESVKPQIKTTEDLYLLRNHTGERAFVPGLKSDESDKIIIKREAENFDFISLKKEITENKSVSISKNKGFNLKDSSDDSDSDMDDIFFVDTKKDASLLVTKSVDHNLISTTNVPQSNKTKFKNKTKKGISYNMSNMNQVDSKNGSNSTSSILQNKKYITEANQMSKEFQISKGYKKSKHLLAKQKSQHNINPGHSSHIHFNPLKIKTVAHNSKKIKIKNKK